MIVRLPTRVFEDASGSPSMHSFQPLACGDYMMNMDGLRRILFVNASDGTVVVESGIRLKTLPGEEEGISDKPYFWPWLLIWLFSYELFLYSLFFFSCKKKMLHLCTCLCKFHVFYVLFYVRYRVKHASFF